MDHAAPIASAFAEFLGHALPKDGGNHTLVLGENHNQIAHLEWLNQHLPQLREQYGIATIGLEMAGWMNVFLWAYQDGTLEKELGSKLKAQQYINAIFESYAKPDYALNMHLQTHLTTHALDQGIRVVAYDGRSTFGQRKKEYAEPLQWYHEGIEKTAKDNKFTVEDFLQDMRINANTNLKEAHQSFQTIWLLSEADWLLHLHEKDPSMPDYSARLHSIENLVTKGHKKISQGKLTSDALSAALFHTMAAPQGNRLTVGGVSHMDGIGSALEAEDVLKPSDLHGTFGHHLFAMGQAVEIQRPHQVTHAVIATTGILHRDKELLDTMLSEAGSKAIRGSQISYFEPNIDKAGHFWHAPDDHPHVVPLEDKFPVPEDTPPDEMDAHKKSHINPLLMPDIKKAADAVREMMNGTQPDRPR